MLKHILVIFFIFTGLYGQINFTNEEKEWIKNNPVIKVGGEMDWAPFDFVNSNGNYDGITKDYLELISQKSGLKFQMVTGYSWSELIGEFKNKQFDMLPAVYYAKDREEFGNYTTSYYTVRDYLFVKEESTIDSIDDLKGKTLAIPKGYTIIPKIKEKYPDIKILETRSIVDSIASVLSNQADATIEVHAVMTYTIKSNAIEGLKIVAQEGLGVNPLYMLVQKHNKTLLSILNKSIIDINKDEQNKIADKWLNSLVIDDHLLNKVETLWILGVFIIVVFLLLYKQHIQKQARVKVEEQKKELETIFQTIKDGIAILDLETNFLSFNNAYLEMTGFTQEELLTKSCVSLGIKEDQEKSKKALQEVMKKGFIENFEKTCVTKNGKHILVNMSVALMPDKNSLLVSAKDVTELKEKERKLNEFVNMVDNHVIISSTDLEGNITNASKAFCTMMGYTKEELIGKNHRIMRHPDMPKEVFEEMWTTISQDEVWHGEVKNRRKGGKSYWAKMIVSPIFDDFGTKIGYSAIRQDITDKKIVEAKTKEQKDLLSLFDYGDAVLFKWNNDENRTTEYVSSNIKNLLGLTKEEFLNNNLIYTKFIHKDDKQRVFDEIEDSTSSEENFLKHEPYRIVTKEGDIKWVLDYTVKQKDESDNTQYLLGYILDITEQENTLKNLERFIDTQDNIVTLTDGKQITFANKKFFEFLDYRDIESFKEEHKCICEFFIENDRFFHLGKIDEDENWIEVMQTIPHSQRIVSIMGSDFKIHAFSVTINKFDENLLIVSLTDISQTMLEHIKLEEKTVHDKLTGAYNREYFEQNYKRLIYEFTNEEYKFGLALLDIDHFKSVNDTYGHDVGDEVLIQFVKTLEKYSRKDDYLIRWGGEEFIMILKVDSVDGLQKALDHLRKVIELQDFPTVGQKTCSIGGTLYEDSEDIEHTIKRADDAVYEAKESGRNKVVIHLIH